jgi:hypothetical protein
MMRVRTGEIIKCKIRLLKKNLTQNLKKNNGIILQGFLCLTWKFGLVRSLALISNYFNREILAT